MNIFISADNKYVHPAKVMLTSLFATNPNEQLTIYFMYHSTAPELLDMLEAHVNAHNARFQPVRISEEDFSDFSTTRRFPVEVYYRMLIPSLLPVTEERALWLDVDMIINGSLREFYNQDFEGKAFVACLDYSNHSDRLVNLGCATDSPYINSGVMLLNLAYMRRYTLKDYHDYYCAYKDHIEFPDQDILNGMFTGAIKIADSNVFNFQRPCQYWITSKERAEILQKAVIIHYNGIYKPWRFVCGNPLGDVWDYYHMITKKRGKVVSSIYINAKRITRWAVRLILECTMNLRNWIYRHCKQIRRLRDFIRNR